MWHDGTQLRRSRTAARPPLELLHRHHLQGHARLLHSPTAKEARLRIESAGTRGVRDVPGTSAMCPEQTSMSPVLTTASRRDCHSTVTALSQPSRTREGHERPRSRIRFPARRIAGRERASSEAHCMCTVSARRLRVWWHGRKAGRGGPKAEG